MVLSGVYFILSAFSENIDLFITPTQIKQNQSYFMKPVRIGGLVEKGSVVWSQKGMDVSFKLTDGLENVSIHYHGVVPQLFREGQGLVVTGKMTDNGFEASHILAKHDENYKPPMLKGVS